MESVDAYCREIEAYLCRKNDGHLVRIVGPSFERVCGWSTRGIPLKIACRGIDRTFERYYAKGPRRRPVHVDFCDADVLDVFDEWKKALGLSTALPATEGAGDVSAELRSAKAESLPAHLERVIARLTSLRAGGGAGLDEPLDAAIRELDAARMPSKGLRGEARAAFLARLEALDAELVAAAAASISPPALVEIGREAASEVAPFKARMTSEAYDRARAACVARLVRERAKLPVLTLT